jgi:hypothetical protein
MLDEIEYFPNLVNENWAKYDNLNLPIIRQHNHKISFGYVRTYEHERFKALRTHDKVIPNTVIMFNPTEN